MTSSDTPMSAARDHHQWLLRTVIDRATRLGKTRDPHQSDELSSTAAAAWAAARYLEALTVADPLAAMRVATELEAELNDGAYLETAADQAERLNYDVAGWVEAARRYAAQDGAAL